jgi:hypothetical protein
LRRYSVIVLASLAIALPPILLSLAWAGWRLGAIVPLSTIAREQHTDHKLLWLGVAKDYAAYKLERIKLVQPEVLLVGSSRCGQAREQIFRPYTTYNACLTAWPLEHVVDFIDRATRQSKPRVVIVALDYFLFGDELAAAWRKERAMDYRQGIDSYKRKLHDVFDFAMRQNWNLDAIKTAVLRPQFEPIDNDRLVGTEAIRGQFGFRDDGSVSVYSGYRNTSAETLAHGAEYVTGSFPGAPHISEIQFDWLKRLSRLAKDRGFSVVAIQFPILKAATDFLDTNQPYWPYSGLWRELRSEETAKRLSDLDISFYDMSRDPAAADPFNFFDPAHPSERGILKTIISLLERPGFRALFPKIERAALQADVAMSPGQQFDLYH